MLNESLRDLLTCRVLPRVKTPGQYVGGELNAVVKDHSRVRGKLCLAFPDTYAIGMSNHGLQVLYHAMNRREDWACERVFAPWPDMEEGLRRNGLPLYSQETFTPLDRFDVVGFTLQYDLGAVNVLTILDLGGIPLRSEDRKRSHPLVIAGGPCAQNPEPMAPFIDLFVIGDGEEMLPRVCDEWLRLKAGGGERSEWLAEMARRLPHVYVPQCYRPRFDADGRAMAPAPAVEGVGEVIRPAIVEDLDGIPLPTSPVVPNVEAVHDRISMEIMRGCPWRCRFCQATAIKRPLRLRKVETLVEAALESYRTTGYNEISLLSLSTSDYPNFDELLRRMQEALRPLGVAISVPSLRVNEQLRTMGHSLDTDRRSGMTLAPEVALDDMRQQVGKRIRNDDLFEGCKVAFRNGFNRVKLYFMCGLPGERTADLDGIVDMAEHISRLGKEVSGRLATVVANVSNFVPKSHSPYQWNAMQRREYFREAHRRLWRRRRLRSVDIKCHDVETSMLEGVFSRGDRRVADAIELAWRRGARFDSWREQFQPQRWHEVLADVGLDVEPILHRPYALEASLPWDHVAIRQGRTYLEREQSKAVVQQAEMGCATGP